MRSRLEDRERWRREDMLQDLRPQGEGDLEDDREEWRLGALVRDGGEVWRPQDDRRDRRWDAGECRRGDKDGCPASLLVLPASRGQREGAELSRDLRWWDEDESEGPGDVAKMSVISEEGKPAEITHDLQRSWIYGQRDDRPTVSVWREETGVWSGRRSQKTSGGTWPGPDVCQ